LNNYINKRLSKCIIASFLVFTCPIHHNLFGVHIFLRVRRRISILKTDINCYFIHSILVWRGEIIVQRSYFFISVKFKYQFDIARQTKFFLYSIMNRLHKILPGAYNLTELSFNMRKLIFTIQHCTCGILIALAFTLLGDIKLI